MNRWREIAEVKGYHFVCDFIDKIATAGAAYQFPCLWLTPLSATKIEPTRTTYTATLYLLEQGTTATIEERNDVWDKFEREVLDMVREFPTDILDINPANLTVSIFEQPLSGSIEYGIKATATIYAYHCA